MFDFSSVIDLPLIWGIIIALAVFMYVCLDGFDLGVGILFPFAPSDNCRDKMMHSISPFWDGNETWLVLGGGGLLAAFPLAYSIIIPAVYIPVIVMLIALIFRGVSFEFRFKAGPSAKKFWDYSFHFGSLVAAIMQGVILGTFVSGFHVEHNKLVAEPFGWVAAFPITVGVALAFGYALLGSTWLIMKTDGITQSWARRSALYVLIYVVVFMGVVSIWVPFLDQQIFDRWFSFPNMLYLVPLPTICGIGVIMMVKAIKNGGECSPFLLSIMLFSLSYLGLGISLWPWVVPFKLSVWECAAANTSLSLILVGACIMLPIVLAYTAYVYYVFRGKTGTAYHY